MIGQVEKIKNKDIQEQMKMEEQQLIQQKLIRKFKELQNKDVKPKKTIVVIGKMGHGKSSFIKMLVSEKDKKIIKVSPKTESVTTQCALYQICPEIKQKLGIKKEQQFFIMDTPGLNSEAKNYLIMEKIRSKLILQKCQVISILYLKNATDYREEENDTNSILMYLTFPITKDIKDKITYFVFTNYDKQMICSNQFETYLSDFSERYKKNNLGFVFERTIRWISYPENQKDVKKLKTFLSLQQYKEIYEGQWQDLKRILTNKEGAKFSVDQLVQVSKRFMDTWKLKFKKVLNNAKQTVLDQIQMKFELKNQNVQGQIWVFLMGLGGSSAVVGGGIGTGVAVAQVGAAALLGSLGVLAIPLTITSIGAGLIGGCVYLYKRIKRQRAKKMISQMQKKKDEKQILKQMQKLQLQQMSVEYAKNYYLQNFKLQRSQSNDVVFQYLPWIESVNIQKKPKNIKSKQFDIQKSLFQQVKYQEIVEQKNGIKKKIGSFYVIVEHEYQFQIKIRRPTEKIIVDVLKETALETFGK